ncbi:4-amino-4-deoxy-L-arabinose transferase-like glycosyltransferase [Mesorhizobium robiniae]|uniref:4-amino-4-deoxy-L-arabinose transferase-like glycosyltransferase n=1 Tax=Mesorhizobium robiniae TaxID=559315 RepID=A0ABV2GVP2_9HYPH
MQQSSISEALSGARKRRWLGADPALCFVLIYFALQIIFVTFMSNGASMDDAEQLAYAGSWQLGYGSSQQPLYNWIVSAATAVFGINLFTLQLVKFSLLASMYASVYCGARLLGLGRWVAAAGALGIFLLPPIGWESQRALTHSVVGVAGCAWTFFCFAWHMKSKSWFSAVALGLAAAAALLGKLNATFFILALLVAGFSVSDYRRTLLSRTGLLTLVVLVAALAPVGLWMLEHSHHVTARSNKFAFDNSGNLLISRATGIGVMLLKTALFSCVAVILFAIAVWRNRADIIARSRAMGTGERFVVLLVSWSLGVVFVGIVISGATRIEDRWLLPVLFLLPLLLALLFSCHIRGDRGLRQIAFWSAMAALVIMPVLALNLSYGRAGKPPIGQLDYKSLYERLREAGDFQVVVSEGPQIPGNLRLYDPDLVVAYPAMPGAASRIRQPVVAVSTGELSQDVLNLLAAAGISSSHAEIRRTTLHYVSQPDLTQEVSYIFVP